MRFPTSKSKSRAMSRGRRFLPAFVPLEGRALLSTFTVRNLNDSGGGSLRDAISSANATPGADVITFAPGVTGTISLASTLEISDGLTITGPGASSLALNGQGQTQDIRVDAGVTVTITGLTVTGGQGEYVPGSQGGGIGNSGILTLDQVAIRNNQAGQTTGGGLGGYGGGIYNAAGARLTLTRSVVTGNAAVITNSLTGGGGIYNDGTLQVSTTTFSGNSIIGLGIASATNGGAIDNGSPTTATTATASVDLCTFVANGSNSIDSAGTLTLRRSSVSGDKLVGVDSHGTGTIDSCTVSGNGMKVQGSSYGGIQARGHLTLVNSTVANNLGAGLIVIRGPSTSPTVVTISSSTIAGNTCMVLQSTTGPLVAGGGINVVSAGGSPLIVLHDTIVAGNMVVPNGGAPVGRDLYTMTTSSLLVGVPEYRSLGYNLIQNPGAATFTGTSTGNIFGVDPTLGPLANNGGPTWTMALLPGSPAIGGGDPNPASAPAVDQRGLPRVVNGRADIGAYAVQ
jgi:hypothetical protein